MPQSTPVLVGIAANDAASDLEELRRLCLSSRLDLFVYIRELEKLGLPSICEKVDDVPAVPAGCGGVHYQLG